MTNVLAPFVLPPLRLGFASTPLPHFVVERMGARPAARPLHPERGERWFAKQTGEGGDLNKRIGWRSTFQ
jgi:hypothetical protein